MLPRVATPVMRPRICLRCLTFFGINMASYSSVLSLRGRGRARPSRGRGVSFIGSVPVPRPIAARDFGSIQTAADFHLDALGAKAKRFFDGLAHGAAESNSLLELRGNF